MPEEIKLVEAPKPVKPSPRELTLESALKDSLITVENLLTTLQRMGVRSLSAEEWVKETKGLLNGSRT